MSSPGEYLFAERAELRDCNDARQSGYSETTEELEMNIQPCPMAGEELLRSFRGNAWHRWEESAARGAIRYIHRSRIRL